ncbi:MAG: shikimate dehydrogenase [Deltaproteobacteria bacterium]|nr:shikimate dehydrogenase [Deltaproteobacteria bacterium]
MTTASTRLLALLGSPVSHSRSPAMMTEALAKLSLAHAYTYLALDVAAPDLATVLSALAAVRCAGLNVTVPHKRAVLAHCLSHDDDVRRIGAANVLSPVPGGWIAHNTDAPAAARALADAGCTLAGKRVAVLGAGGAARAVCVGLAREGVSALDVIARDPAQSAACLSACDGLLLSHRASVSWHDTDAHAVLARADIVVQCTSLGMTSETQSTHAYTQALGWLASVPRGATAMDLVYSPEANTPWLLRAKSHGLYTVDGLGMLAHQGALALARWVGGAPPARVLRRFLDAHGTDA